MLYHNLVPKITPKADSDRILIAVINYFKSLEGDLISGSPDIISHICFLEDQFTLLNNYYEEKGKPPVNPHSSQYIPIHGLTENKIMALRQAITRLTQEYLKDTQVQDLFAALRTENHNNTLSLSSLHDQKTPSAPPENSEDFDMNEKETAREGELSSQGENTLLVKAVATIVQKPSGTPVVSTFYLPAVPTHPVAEGNSTTVTATATPVMY